MIALYMHSYTAERNFHPDFTEKGFRYATDFKINFLGAAYETIVLTLLGSQDKKLVLGTTRTETTVTDAAVVLSKEGLGWAVIADVPGADPWISYKNSVIRFRKQFLVELPVAPAVSSVPVLGNLADKLGATRTVRVEAEGVYDVLSQISQMQCRSF